MSTVLDARERLIVALDVPSVKEAESIVARLGDAAVFFKIGYQLGFAGGLEGHERQVLGDAGPNDGQQRRPFDADDQLQRFTDRTVLVRVQGQEHDGRPSRRRHEERQVPSMVGGATPRAVRLRATACT